MSKYVEHKHGLILGSDNVFFIHDNFAEFGNVDYPDDLPKYRGDYNSIVYFESYSFEELNFHNTGIRTPAHQLVWGEPHLLQWDAPFVNRKGETVNWTNEQEYYAPSFFATSWLNNNVGPQYDRWDTYTFNIRTNESIFFKRRTDALAFIKEIGRNLKGIK